MNINQEIIKGLLEKFESEKYIHYNKQDEAIKSLIEKYPNNNDLLGVILKVGIINSFYSTNIFKPFDVAKKIYEIKDFDIRVKKGDFSLINQIANVTISGKNKNFYSFATKYCYHHNQEKFVIYDSFVESQIWKNIQKDRFTKIKRKQLKDYYFYMSTFLKFKEFYHLDKFNNREIELALWIKNKEE